MIGVSYISSSACLAVNGGTAASIAVVYPKVAYLYPVAKVEGTIPPVPDCVCGVLKCGSNL